MFRLSVKPELKTAAQSTWAFAEVESEMAMTLGDKNRNIESILIQNLFMKSSKQREFQGGSSLISSLRGFLRAIKLEFSAGVASTMLVNSLQEYCAHVRITRQKYSHHNHFYDAIAC